MKPVTACYSIAYTAPVCKCGSHLIVNERSDVWRFYCHVCRQNIERARIIEAESLFFEGDADAQQHNRAK